MSAVHGKLPIARLVTSQPQKPARTLAKLLPQSASVVHTAVSPAAAAARTEQRGAVCETDGRSSAQPEVRSSHNIVEKRYRMSINDKLGELRELVDGKDSKVCLLHTHWLSVCLSVCQMSINDKLGELRELVDGKDSKVCLLHTHWLSVCLSVCLSDEYQ